MNQIFDDFYVNQSVAFLSVGEDAFAEIEEDTFVVITKPKNIAEPSIAPQNLTSVHTLVTDDMVAEYFADLSEERIQNVEGMCALRYGLGCDYCKTSVRTNEYYYCTDCHKDMCLLCKSEVSEEIAVANGAKNYASRKEALNLCQQQHALVDRQLALASDKNCDVCSENCKEGCRYVELPENHTFDICERCWVTSQTEIDAHGGKDSFKKCFVSFMQNTRFGSLFDWKPIITDENNNYVFVNINRDSLLCGKFAARMIDDHGRCGYYVLDKIASIDELVKKLNDYANDKEWIESTGWTKHYNFPIPRLMAEYGCTIHYG